MSYVALYRKFRPQEFEDVKGQEHIVKTLKNQIQSDMVGHAYLFNGTRGTGKTTIAKLFARAVNCEHPVNGSPCNECPTCKAILNGTSLNVIEIDAASNNGVDDIRKIREEVAYMPTTGKYKVYIIDEAHMLSASAFNAFLKTLEEPPSYVIFILATTETHKIPITIISRCQRYDFRRISVETIADRLANIAKTEGIKIEERALYHIAKMADGSMRDAISLMDRCVAFYAGEELSFDEVLETLGAVDTDIFSRLFTCIYDTDVVGAVKVVEDVIMLGRDLSQFVSDFTWYLRNLMLIKNSDRLESVVDMSAENLAVLKENAAKINISRLMRFIRVFSELSNKIKQETQKRVLLEMNIIRLCKPEMDVDLDSLVERIVNLEDRLDKGNFVMSGPIIANEETPKEPGIKVADKLPAAFSEDIKLIISRWEDIKGKFTPELRAYFNKAYLSCKDDILQIAFDKNSIEESMMTDDRKQLVNRIVDEVVGKSVEIQYISNDEAVKSGKEFLSMGRKNFGMINFDIEISKEET